VAAAAAGTGRDFIHDVVGLVTWPSRVVVEPAPAAVSLSELSSVVAIRTAVDANH